MKNIVDFILYESSYWELYLLVTGYFLFLYFIVGSLFLYTCKALYKKNILQKIVDIEVDRIQKIRELKYSIGSILIFGFSGFPVIYGIRAGLIELGPDTMISFLVGLVVLNLWNELHFFSVHRLMHVPFFMKHVHKVHHQTVVPTIYSVYSFHWFEALLLSTVPITIVPFISFSPAAIALYPLTSILFNFSGHCNFRFGNGVGSSWKLFGTHHNEHHFKFKKNYGFVTDLLDRIFIKK